MDFLNDMGIFRWGLYIGVPLVLVFIILFIFHLKKYDSEPRSDSLIMFIGGSGASFIVLSLMISSLIMLGGNAYDLVSNKVKDYRYEQKILGTWKYKSMTMPPKEQNSNNVLEIAMLGMVKLMVKKSMKSLEYNFYEDGICTLKIEVLGDEKRTDCKYNITSREGKLMFRIDTTTNGILKSENGEIIFLDESNILLKQSKSKLFLEKI